MSGHSERIEPERRWLVERFFYWIATQAEIAAFSLTTRRRHG